MIGTTLAHYRITAALGAGGMGEVWRATDTRLGREVALKVLPAGFADDPERMVRFEREAKVLASLNHPNIAHLYGLETATSSPSEAGAEAEAGAGRPPRQDERPGRQGDPASNIQHPASGRVGDPASSIRHPASGRAGDNSNLTTQNSKLGAVHFLVMELVEGEGLDELIARGSVPPEDAIPIARQIAEALEAAHEAGERRLHQPHFLPGGRSMLYTAVTLDANDGEVVVDREGTRTSLGLGNGTTQPAWSPSGHILFTRATGTESALLAVPFSLDTMSRRGEPFRLAVDGAISSAAADGTVAYSLLRPEPQQLVWVDRSGRVLGGLGQPLRSTIWSPAISPDGRRVAATLDWTTITVWDSDRDIQTRITGDTERALFAEWFPNGRDLAYMLLGGGEALMARRADGSGDARALLRQRGAAAPAFSADGSWLAYYVVDPTTARDLWAARTDALDQPFVLLSTPSNEALPRISPDGGYVAYQSDTSGRWEVYVQPFPDGDGRWRISADGGQHPEWSPRGDELFFVSENDLMAVDVAMAPEFRVGTPRRLFSGDDVGTRLSLPRHVERFYDAAPDDERFVVVKGIRMGASDVVVSEGLVESAAAGHPALSSGAKR